MIAPSACYGFTIRLQTRNRPGMLGRVASAMGEAGGDIGAVDIPSVFREHVAPAVAGGVASAARETAVARRRRRLDLSGIR